ncbi:TPA: hypothetical protein ACH3X1_006564 [Trebouxia sp. C0004]
MSDVSPHANLLVELDIYVDQFGFYNDYADLQMFAEHLGWLLSLCHHLQSLIVFKFTGGSSAGFLDAEKLVVDRHTGACLHRLSLSKVCFRLLDLQNAVHVTSLELHNVDAIPGFTLMLPPWLQSYESNGCYLCTPQARHMLLACNCLNKLNLLGNKVRAQYNMPLLPSSLRQLDIHKSRAERG